MDMSTPLLLKVAAEIDTNPTTFYRGRGGGSLRLQTPVIGSRSELAMSVHPTYFDLATPLPSAIAELLVLVVVQCVLYQRAIAFGAIEHSRIFFIGPEP